VGVDWKRFGTELKRRRDNLHVTQDALAAKIGVRWNTVARLETGKRRPSIEMLEKLAVALSCRVRYLLTEEEPMPETAETRSPSMKGAPSYFRYGVADAGARKVLGRDINSGKAARADYSHPGWHLAIHLDEYLSDEAREELDQLTKQHAGEAFGRELMEFLKREFPACMELIPLERRRLFMQGFYRAIDQDRLELDIDVSDLLEGSDDD
jgi:transcriptional regulator with XRE-family HTH domain